MTGGLETIAARGRAGCRLTASALPVLIVLGVLIAPPAILGAAPAERAEAAPRSIEERIAELEALVQKLRAEVEALRPSGAGAGGPATVEELQKRIDALAQEIERLRIGEAAAPAAQEPVSGFGPAAAKVYTVKKGVSVGGYGEMLYQNFDGLRDDGSPSAEQNTLDFLRAVLYFGYKWSDHLLFNSEIEHEHAVAGDGEPGEVAVEFAYVDYRRSRGFGVRGGLLLVPIGFLSELHEPPIFYGATRPEVESVILPSTWRENGMGVYGDLGPVSYRAYIVAGLDASGFTAGDGIRGGRQEGAESKADDLALAARLDWTPSPGLLVGASSFAGGAAQGDPALGNARVTLWDAHAEWNARGLHLRGVYAKSSLHDAGAVSLATGENVGSRARGWYAEAAFNVLSIAGRGERELSPFVRYEALDTQADVAPGLTRDPANDRSVRTYGLTFRPLVNLAIKADFQDFGNRAGTGVDRFNLALGYLF